MDAFGHLWVCDRNNHRILRFNHASSKLTGANADFVLGQPDFTSNTARTTQNGLNWPADVWMDPAGRLWVADVSNQRVLRFDNAATKSNFCKCGWCF
jgi:NHL repeat.